MTNIPPSQLALEPSSIEGLDLILRGGFLAGGIYIIQGQPGTGKTILGNQICFNRVARGGRALFVTLLAESHSRMLMHLTSMDFFKADVIPDALYYISAFTELESSGLPGLMRLLRKEALAHQANLIVLDGLVAVEKHAGSDMEFKKFIHELQSQCTMLECSMFLLTSASSHYVSAEHTMVDGVLELSYRLHGWRSARDLQIRKRRGADFLGGLHAFNISSTGITVFPRIEALPLVLPLTVERRTLSMGDELLDRMMGGGVPVGSTTLLIGAPGIGKTTLGMQFLSQCTADNHGLFLGLYETPAALKAKAEALKLEVVGLLKDGCVEILWNSPTEGSIDQLCSELLRIVEAKKVKRLFVDGLEALQKLADDPARVGHILSALTNHLRAHGVTTIYTAETEYLIGASGPLDGISVKGVSSIAENMLAMRFVTAGTSLLRLISVIKVRDAAIDNRLRVFEIATAGICIDESPARAEQVLHAWPVQASAQTSDGNHGAADVPGA